MRNRFRDLLLIVVAVVLAVNVVVQFTASKGTAVAEEGAGRWEEIGAGEYVYLYDNATGLCVFVIPMGGMIHDDGCKYFKKAKKAAAK